MKLHLVLIGLLLVSTTFTVCYAQDEGDAEDAAEGEHVEGEHGGYGEGEEMDEELDREEEIRLHKEEFDVMDTNGNGKLELEELEVAAKDEEIEASEIKEFVEELDTNKDNAVSWDEYMDGLFNQEFDEGFPEEYEDEEAFLKNAEEASGEHTETEEA